MAMRIAFSVLGVLILLFAVALLVPIDPEERRPGTRLGGEVVEGAADWSFYEGRKKIYVETSTWYLVPHSVTTVSWVVDGELYVPCGNCATKTWPKYVVRDPDVRLKIDGKVYERKAVLITDPHAKMRFLGRGDHGDLPPGIEIYRMDPRDAA